MSERNSLTIENIAEYKSEFLAAIAGSKTAVIDLAEIPSVDAAGMQLLGAVAAEAGLVKHDVRFSGTLSEGFLRGVVIAGLVDDSCLTGEDLDSAVKAVIKV